MPVKEGRGVIMKGSLVYRNYFSGLRNDQRNLLQESTALYGRLSKQRGQICRLLLRTQLPLPPPVIEGWVRGGGGVTHTLGAASFRVRDGSDLLRQGIGGGARFQKMERESVGMITAFRVRSPTGLQAHTGCQT